MKWYEKLGIGILILMAALHAFRQYSIADKKLYYAKRARDAKRKKYERRQQAGMEGPSPGTN